MDTKGAVGFSGVFYNRGCCGISHPVAGANYKVVQLGETGRASRRSPGCRQRGFRLFLPAGATHAFKAQPDLSFTKILCDVAHQPGIFCFNPLGSEGRLGGKDKTA